MTTISSYNPSNNYTVSSTEISESVGDGISGVLEGTMVTQGTLTITPSITEGRFKDFQLDTLNGTSQQDDYFLYTHYNIIVGRSC